MPYPVTSTGAWILTIYGNPLPQIWESPINLTLSLMENSPIIWLRCPFLRRYSVTNSPTVPVGISTRAVEWTSWQILSISQQHNLVDLGLYTINTLDKGASIWNPANRVVRPTYAANWSATYHILEKLQQLETLWVQSPIKAIKLILKIGGKIRNLIEKIIQGIDHIWTQLMLVQKHQIPKY